MMKNYREKIYKSYSSNSGKSLAPESIAGLSSREAFYKNILNNFFPARRDIKILEIGCGYGSFQYFINAAGYTNSLGIDDSEEQVSEAHRLGIKNVTLGNLVAYLKDLENNSLDILIAIDVIEHFTKEELSDLIDDFYRVLKEDGLVITHQPNAEGIFGNGIRYGDFTHELAFTRRSISQIFCSSEFKDVQSFEDKPIAHGLKSFIRLFLWNYFVRPVYKILLSVESGAVDKDIIFSQNFLTVIRK
ncbi:MAG: methyltransferase domain-containing protein [Methyloprofundus sp.]|nr:methyltransferase domain-containing protein [Methyloprofundus sp.]